MTSDTGRMANGERRQGDADPPSCVLRPSSASACAKLILCGEHAVVYGRPAIAVPVSGVRAMAVVAAGPPGSGLVVNAPDLPRRWRPSDTPDDPFAGLIAAALARLGAPPAPDLELTVTSAIPIASGMGSGAAVATAAVRALAAAFGQALPPAEVSALVYESERALHGTPSGIDNTVVAYEQAVWFVRGQETGRHEAIATSNELCAPPPALHPPHSDRITPLVIAAPFTLVIGDTGVRSATRLPVGEVRRRWQAEPARYEGLFDAVAAVVHAAREALARGDLPALGRLLDENHRLLQAIGVSSPELDRLVTAARTAGAPGAKLSGAGRGGAMIALAPPGGSDAIRRALLAAGAARVLETTVVPGGWPDSAV